MDPKHILNLGGRDYPLYQGILNEAHQRGLQAIETQLIQIPDKDNDNVAIVKAIIRMKDGSVFEDFGDASPRNCSSKIASALIRMSSTRAKGRALRDAVNVGQTMLEELGDLADSVDELRWQCSNEKCGAPVPSTQAATTNLAYRRIFCEQCIPIWQQHLEKKAKKSEKQDKAA